MTRLTRDDLNDSNLKKLARQTQEQADLLQSQASKLQHEAKKLRDILQNRKRARMQRHQERKSLK